jgi:hypothetical protein
VNVEIVGDVAFDLAQEAEEFTSSMATIAAADDRAGRGVESREQGERSVTRIVVRTPLDLPGAHG